MNKKLEELTDEEFLNITQFHTNIITEYLEEVLYDFIPYYIATAIKCNALWDNNFKRIVNTSLEAFSPYRFRNKIDYDRIKQTLRKDYNIKKW